MVVCHFCVETVNISEFIFLEPPLFAFFIFWGLWGGWRLHPILAGGLLGGGVGSEIEFGWALGILTQNICGCVSRSSRIMTAGQREPLRNSKERQVTSLDWFYSLSAWCQPYKGSLLETFWTFCLFLSSQRSNQRYLCKKNRPSKKINQTSFWEDPREFNSRVWSLGPCAGDRGRLSISECLRAQPPELHLWAWDLDRDSFGKTYCRGFPLSFVKTKGCNLAQWRGKTSTENMRVTRGKHVVFNSHGARMTLGGAPLIQTALRLPPIITCMTLPKLVARLQFWGVFWINLHCSYSFLVLLTRLQLQELILHSYFENVWQLQFWFSGPATGIIWALRAQSGKKSPKWVPRAFRLLGAQKVPNGVEDESKLTTFQLFFDSIWDFLGPQEPKGSRNSFRTLFATLGPKGPSDPCSRPKFSQNYSHMN